MKPFSESGFTLIEVLLALSILAIALTALLKASASTVAGTFRIKEKTLSHLVSMQAISLIQLELIRVNTSQNITKQMTVFGQTWYWNADIKNTPLLSVDKIIVTTSTQAGGPFKDTLIGYRTHKS